MALTPKQEKFCQCVVSGMSYKDAYINAYDTNGKESTIFAEAGKLALREDIQEKIQALQKPIETAAKIQGLNKKEERIKYIQERIKLCEERQDESSILRYVDMLNKIDNLYKEAEEKKDNDNTLTNLDTRLLTKIAKSV